MDILDKALQAYQRQLGWRALADLIAEKAAAQGIQLTPREKAALARRLAKSDGAEEITLHKCKGTTDRNISITITPDESAKLIGSVQQVLDDVPSITKSLIADTVPSLTARFRKRWPQQAAAEQRQMAAFARRLQRRWKEPLSLLSMILTSRELGESIHEKLHSQPAANARPITNEVIVRLHARACQVAAEVIDHLRPYYKLASQNVHANPNAAYYRLGLIDQNAVLLAGASNFGLGEPAQHVALALAHVSVAVSQLRPTLDSNVIIKILLNLSSEVGIVSSRVQKELETYVKAKRTRAVTESAACGEQHA